MSLNDIKIPADSADKQTTDAKSARPPVEFTVTKGTTANLISITDANGVQNRLPTVSYRVYFLPAAFAPLSIGVTATARVSPISDPSKRQAAQKVATLVTSISAPGQGTILPYSDVTNFGQAGYYYCVGVNRSGVEAPPQNMVTAP